MTLSEQHFEQWLGAYGSAWEATNGDAFGRLFEQDAIYYWTPLTDPLKGRDAIIAGFSNAVGRQRAIDFGARVLYVQAQLGCAHWSCSFTRIGTGKRIHMDGVLVAQFGDSGRAISFREWWHADGE